MWLSSSAFSPKATLLIFFFLIIIKSTRSRVTSVVHYIITLHFYIKLLILYFKQYDRSASLIMVILSNPTHTCTCVYCTSLFYYERATIRPLATTLLENVCTAFLSWKGKRKYLHLYCTCHRRLFMLELSNIPVLLLC